MKRVKAIIAGYFFASISGFAQSKLDIEIIDIRNNRGNIMLQLFDEDENILTQKIIKIENNKCLFSINDIKPGKYAIRYYHDENHNMKMETNIAGKPTEGYGFSNNSTGKFGPPSFEKWIFELKGDKKITLKTTY